MSKCCEYGTNELKFFFGGGMKELSIKDAHAFVKKTIT
jgi:hypothetical protein